MILKDAKAVLFLGAFVLFTYCFIPGCTPPPPGKIVLSTGFELPATGPQPVVPEMPPVMLSNEQVHSGSQAVKLDKNQPNALLCGTTWQALGGASWKEDDRSHHLRLRLWAWMPYDRQNAVVVTVLAQRPSPTPGAGATVLHIQRLALNKVISQYQQWMPTTVFVSLPHELQPLDEIAICAWGQHIGDRNAVYIDDVSLENAD
ncbi:hypothetical protein Q5H93_10115 [Hymenobacter sp. ASUV-10]|uniref:DUF3047 domain-containing protein n=1 Tax=Hymenobacter aranciens TaxID=3063996 RepID=A0ABT9B9Z7_9BACT|nr:hypothetical protein [Hymenobacter sp. ASUV-10]MDO7875085.1 hypothetical protein [Hymenobacter sp. ASUV-10]